MLYIIYFLTIIQAQDQQSYNYPLEGGQMNFIFLKDYTPIEIEAPSYTITEQSIIELYQESSSRNNIIKQASNYILETGYSNLFWFINTNNILNSGYFDQDGSIKKQIIFDLQEQDCININLIKFNYGLLTCLNDSNIQFMFINSSSLQIQQFLMNEQFNQSVGVIQTYIKQLSSNSLDIIVLQVQNQSTQLYNYSYNNQNIQLQNQTDYQGNYTQVILSEQQNFLFLLNTQYLEVIQIYSNTSNQIQFLDLEFQNFSIYEIKQNLFQIAMNTNLQLLTFTYQAQLKEFSNLQQRILSESSQVILLSVRQFKIYLITDIYVSCFQISEYVKYQAKQLLIENYELISNISFALLNENRKMILIEQNQSDNITFSTLFLNQPQILVTQIQSLDIYHHQLELSLEITIFSLLTQQQSEIINLNLITVNISNDQQCPITFKDSYETITLNYPDVVYVPYDNYFIGPNILRSETASQLYILDVIQSRSTKLSISQSYQLIYSILCTNYHNVPIYCSQFPNNTIIINQYLIVYQQNAILINSREKINKCQCYQDIVDLKVIMTFSDTVIIQNFDYYFNPTNQSLLYFGYTIINSLLFKNKLFIISNNGSLQIYNLNDTQTPLQQINNQSMKTIYVNLISYPDFLFIDNSTYLLIVYYDLQFEIINSIKYPTLQYNLSSFGILENGIFLSLYDFTSPNSYLYYYPKQNIYYQQQQSLNYQFNLTDFKYYDEQILSSYSSLSYYLLLSYHNGTCCFLIIFGGKGSPFQIPQLSVQEYPLIIQMNVVQSLEQKEDMIYQLLNNSCIYNGSYAVGEYEFVTFYENSLQSNTTIFFQAQSSNCSNQTISQNFIISQNKNLIQSIINNKSINLLGYNKLIIQPEQYFMGSLDNFMISCDECSLFRYKNPIQNYTTLNFTYQAAFQQDFILYMQDNKSLYYVTESNYQRLIKLYDFPIEYEKCNVLFIEQLTGFPVSICNDENQTIFYSFNLTSQQFFSYISFTITNFYKADYKNGILQIISSEIVKILTKYSYQSYYLWITDQGIQLTSIYQLMEFQSNILTEFVYFSMSKNFSLEPCQVFGFTVIFYNRQLNPQFYLLKTCIPSSISQIFGYTSNQYNEVTNIYFQISQWQLKQTQQFQFFIDFSLIQIGETNLIKPNIISVYFLAPIYYTAFIYQLTFNLTNGMMITFQQKSKLYVKHTAPTGLYQFYWTSTNILASIQELSSDQITLMIYPIVTQEIYKTKQNLIYNVGMLNTSFNVTNQQYSYKGNFFIRYDEDCNCTFLYPIQNYISIDLTLSNVEITQLQITALNSLSQSTNFIQLNNLNYIPIIPIDPINDNSDNNKLLLILSITLGILLLIILCIISWKVYIKYKIKQQQQQQQQQQSNYLEMR